MEHRECVQQANPKDLLQAVKSNKQLELCPAWMLPNEPSFFR
eukprot:CAMPEP_0117660754 /NCGR_PEP_ID=MMETSP0804-20121206/7136_1 /TAXON_ID=1074897 /ORGANISM="Tetraselmis astigmatica, Strain CCMP880" /LENGTH=41 /DNA_ID= /DNA_START= /DNA_END= /DNA_ORIENTATION=